MSSRRQREGPLDRAADVQLPRAGVDERDVEMDQQVVQSGRRDVVAQRLERHAPVARGELQLLEAERIVGQRRSATVIRGQSYRTATAAAGGAPNEDRRL